MSLLKNIAYKKFEFFKIDQIEANNLANIAKTASPEKLDLILNSINNISQFSDIVPLGIIIQLLLELSQNANDQIAKKAKTIITQFFSLKPIKEKIENLLLIIEKNKLYQDLEIVHLGHVFAVKNIEAAKINISTEGMPYASAIDFFKKNLEEYKIFLQNKIKKDINLEEKYQDLIQDIIEKQKQLKICQDYYVFFEKASANVEIRNKLYEDIEQKIKNLNNGESLIIPGGWSTKTIKHAILYEFTKISDNNYSWRIFNTGSGVSLYHKTTNKINKWQTAKEVSNLTEKQLNIEFIKKITNLRIISNGNKEKKCDELYDLINSLNQKGAKLVDNPQKIQSKQKGGFCTWKSLKAWLNFHWSKEDYKDFKRFVDSYSFLSFQNILANLKPTNEEFKIIEPYIKQKYQKRLLKFLKN